MSFSENEINVLLICNIVNLIAIVHSRVYLCAVDFDETQFFTLGCSSPILRKFKYTRFRLVSTVPYENVLTFNSYYFILIANNNTTERQKIIVTRKIKQNTVYSNGVDNNNNNNVIQQSLLHSLLS